jgi:plasmid stabilization system protein ParE
VGRGQQKDAESQAPMKYQLSLRRAAEEEALAAFDYYEAQQAGLGVRFHNDVAELLNRIQGNPHLYPLSEKPPYRKAVLRTFPFCIYYCILEHKIVIIAVHDSRSHPRRWQSRL